MRLEVDLICLSGPSFMHNPHERRMTIGRDLLGGPTIAWSDLRQHVRNDAALASFTLEIHFERVCQWPATEGTLASIHSS